MSAPHPAWAYQSGDDLVFGKHPAEIGYKVGSMPDVTAPEALVADADGTVLYERNADTERKIASMTKMMTAYVMLKYMPENGTIYVDDVSAAVPGSRAEVMSGDVLTVKDALYCLMLPSGNDAAEAIARSVGKVLDPKTKAPLMRFVKQMNIEASNLGMGHTVYANPHGLDAYEYEGNHHSTAHDQLLLIRELMRNKTLRSVVATQHMVVYAKRPDGSKRPIELTSTDQLLGKVPYMIGIKTGTTDYARKCFAGAANRDGHEWYTVVMGAEDSDAVFGDTRRMLEWAFPALKEARASFSWERDMSTEGNLMHVADVSDTDYIDKAIPASVSTDCLRPVALYDAYGPVSVSVDVRDSLSGTVNEGDVVGSVTMSRNGRQLGKWDVIATESVAPPSGIDGLVVRMRKWFLGVTGSPEVASRTSHAEASVHMEQLIK